MAERMAPHWLDDVIANAHGRFGGYGENAIAHAVANSPQLHEAIKRGLDEAARIDPNAKGAGKEQVIRVAVVERINRPN